MKRNYVFFPSIQYERSPLLIPQLTPVGNSGSRVILSSRTNLHFPLLKRDTKLTFYAKQNMNESILGKIGWGKRSSMVERYVNLSSVDVEQAVMGICGQQG